MYPRSFLGALCLSAVKKYRKILRLSLWVGLAFTLLPARAQERLPGQCINEINFGYTTPHVPWAQPYARGPVRAFFIVPHTSAAREVVELAQRLSLEVYGEAVIDSAHLGSDSRYIAPLEGTRPEEKVARLREKLQRPYDVLVIANVHWDAFPREIQYYLLKQVADGAGLLITYPRNLRPEILRNQTTAPREAIAGPVPWAGLSFFKEDESEETGSAEGQKTAAKVVTSATLKKGRIAVLDYGVGSATRYGGFGLTPQEEYTFETAASYEGYHLLVARALLWAANRLPEVRFTIWPEEPLVVSRTESSAKPVTIGLENTLSQPLPLKIKVFIRNRWNETEFRHWVTLSLPPGRAEFSFVLPALPGGDHFVGLILYSRRGVENFGAFTLRVEPTVRLAAIELEKEGYERTEEVRGKVVLSGPAPEETSLHLTLRDSYQRLFERWEQPVASGATEVAFSRPLRRAVSLCGRVRVQVRRGGRCEDEHEAVFYVRKRPLDKYPQQLNEYPVLIWGTLPGILGHFAYTRLREAGFTAVLTHVDSEGNTGRRLARDDLMIVPYCARVGTSFPSGGKVCFADPAFRQAQEKAVRAKAAPLRLVAPLVYSLGDENYLPAEAGTHPADGPVFASFLRRRYRSIGRLNEVWGTRLSSFEEAVALQPEKETPAYFARRNDFELFRKWQYAEFHHFLAGVIRAADPTARVGAEGSQPGNLEETVARLQFWGPYRRLRYNTLLRSLVSRELLRGNWFGGYLSQRRNPLTLPDFVWQALFDGNNLIEYFCIYTAERIFDTGFNFGEWNQRFWPAFQEIVDGLGQLVAASEVEVEGLALYHSEVSAQVQGFLPQPDYEAAHEAWLQLLSDLGVQPFYVTSAQVGKGRLRVGDVRVLILPALHALSEEEAAEIRAFVERGGLVIADVTPGLFDGYGRPRPEGALDDLFGVESHWKAVQWMASPLEGSGAVTVGDWRFDFRGVQWPETQVNQALRLTTAQAAGRAGETQTWLVRSWGRGTAWLLNARVTNYPHWRSRGEEMGVRQWLLHVLAAAGHRPFAEVLDLQGRPLRAVRQVRFRRGGTRLLGLLRHLGFDENRGEVRLREAAWVFNVRTGEAYGHTDRVSVTLKPGDAVLLGLLPYEVQGVEVMAPQAAGAGRDLRVRVRLRWRKGKVSSNPDLSGHVWHLRLFPPDGRRRREYSQTAYTDRPEATFTVPLAFNDPAGRWRFVVQHINTGLRGRTEVEVKGEPL
ncbi:MAG TPA: hypothetical protein EYP85_04445 [Armatimonadetes bacterium]|nr:hypothetical protein [Armatimonadota bacterium]